MSRRSGDDFARFYRENWRMVRTYFSRRLSDSAAADDLANETFTRVFASTTPERPVPPRSYLFSAAHNIIANHYRDHRGRTIEPESEESDQVADPTPLPDRDLIARERLKLLWRAIDALPPRQRQVFLMRKMDYLSNGEIADRLGISVSAVEKHIAAGLNSCRTFVDSSPPIENVRDEPYQSRGEADHG